MAIDSIHRLSIQGFDGDFRVTAVRGAERVHAPFRVEITGQMAGAAGERAAVAVEDLLGRKAEIVIASEGADRVLVGVLDRIEAIHTGHRLTLVPRIASLGDAVDHKVFVDKTMLDIALDVLRGRGLDVESRVTRELPRRAQCVQAFESDLAFVARILAEEGVLWHIEIQDGADVVVLSDHQTAYPAIGGDARLPFAPDAGLDAREHVFAIRLGRALVHSRVFLGDYDFENPRLDQASQSGSGSLERYEYPGGYRDPALGALLASIRREEAQAKQLVLHGSTTCRRLALGAVFTLADAPREDLNRRWLVLEVAYQGIDLGAGPVQEGHRYLATFVAVPAEAPYRPTRPRSPTLGGVQTATVTGPAGAEIHTDSRGRVTVLHRWDRLRAPDETSSRWLRPVQPPTSGGFFLPRIGWEVLVGFAGSSGDEPYEIGRLMNAVAPPPEGLPAGKTRSAFGSLTTPGGGSANLFRIEDIAGTEDMTLVASKDLNERTENDKETSVTDNDAHEVAANHTEIVGIVQEVKVDGAQTYSVGGNRTVGVGGTLVIQAGTESVSIGAVRALQVGGDYVTQVNGSLLRTVGGAKAEAAIEQQNRHVSGVSSVLVGGSWDEIGGLASSTSVLGASVLSVAGAMNVRAASISFKASRLEEDYGTRNVTTGGSRIESFGGAARYAIGGSLTMAGSDVAFVASGSISIKAAGVTVTITPGSIDVKGNFDSSVATVVTGDDIND